MGEEVELRQIDAYQGTLGVDAPTVFINPMITDDASIIGLKLMKCGDMEYDEDSSPSLKGVIVKIPIPNNAQSQDLDEFECKTMRQDYDGFGVDDDHHIDAHAIRDVDGLQSLGKELVMPAFIKRSKRKTKKKVMDKNADSSFMMSTEKASVTKIASPSPSPREQRRFIIRLPRA